MFSTKTFISRIYVAGSYWNAIEIEVHCMTQILPKKNNPVHLTKLVSASVWETLHVISIITSINYK